MLTQNDPSYNWKQWLNNFLKKTKEEALTLAWGEH